MFRVAKNLNKKHRRFFLFSALFVVAAYFPLFLHLETDTIHAWDESMFAMRAYHLASEGKFLENFGDYPAGFDNPNIKPPFGTYFQALGLKLSNYNELGLRLPITMFCLATGISFIWFFNRYFNNTILGFLSAMVLVCSPGYVMPHVARTGDHEGVLVFLVLAAVLSAYQFIETEKPKWCYAAAIFFALGFLTKSVVAFFPIPAIVIYIIAQGKLKQLFNNKATWKGAMLLLAIIAIQYAAVWYLSPYNFRFLGFGHVHDRFVNTVHGHAAPKSFYFLSLVNHKFLPWLYLLPFGVLLTMFEAYKPYRKLSLLLLGASISHLLIISLSKTKLPWYDASVYPWLAVVAALPLYALIENIHKRLQLKGAVSAVLSFTLLLMVFASSYINEVTENLSHPITSPQQQMGSLLKKVRDNYSDIKTFKLLDNDPKGNLVVSFYIASMNDHKGFNISYQKHLENITVGDTVGFCNAQIIHWADSLYVQQTLVYTNGCKVVVLEDTIRTDRTTQH